MKLSPLAQIKLAAVLMVAYALLGCESPQSTAEEQAPPLYPTVSAVSQPQLVTVTQAAPLTPVNVPLVAEESAPTPTPGAEKAVSVPVQLSERLQEVVKLAQSGVGDDVILAFVQNSTVPFNPTPEEILYLTDVGVSDVVVTALVNHRGTVAAPPVVQAPPAYNGPTAAPGQPGPPPGATYNPEPQVAYVEPAPVQYVSQPPNVEYGYFYDSLTPYGAWVEVADYGWCWQPTVAVVRHDWRPYCDRGRWMNTDCGYYWQSDYSWGWAPFHYGRWFHHPGRGWCWRPDSVWAPAWVSWRYTDTHCGWAPLPPGSRFHEGGGFTYYGAHVGVSFGFGLHRDAWTFVSANRIHDSEVSRHALPAREHALAYRQSTVVNNYVIHNNTVINHGVPADRVRGLPQTEVRKVTVRDLPERNAGGVRPDRLHQEGSELVVYRPKPPVVSPQAPHRALESTTARPLDGQAAAAARPAAGVTIRQQPGGVTAAPGVRSGTEVAAPTTVQRPNRALSAPGTSPTSLTSPTPTASVPSTTAPRAATQVYRAPTTTITPRSGSEPTPTVRSERPNTMPVVPQPSTPAPQAVRVPNQASQVTRPAPQPVAPPTQTYRQEVSRPPMTVAPERSVPSTVYQPPRVEAPAYRSAPSPNYSMPVQPSYSPPVNRPAPSYSPPAVQSRPAPSAPAYTPPPASRPAPQATPAQSPPDRSNNRRQN